MEIIQIKNTISEFFLICLMCLTAEWDEKQDSTLENKAINHLI